MMYWLYQALWYPVLIWFNSPFSGGGKLESRIRGLRQQAREIRMLARSGGLRSEPAAERTLLFHFASLGEWEQGRSVLEAWHRDFPDDRIAISFFSASGYEQVWLPDYVWKKFYLPWDRPTDLEPFMDFIRPSAVLVVKYEIWPVWFRLMSKRRIPFFVFSARFRAGHWTFKPGMGFALKALGRARVIYVQDQESLNLLVSRGISSVISTGDTRADRVLQLSSAGLESGLKELLEQWKGADDLLVAGSTWPGDEEVLVRAWQDLKPRHKLILVPHEWDKKRIDWYRQHFGDVALWSQWFSGTPEDPIWQKFPIAESNALERARVLIVDKTGWLSRLYSLASWTYVGGGFGVGIHNILEPAVWGKPVAFGPNFGKFREAVDLMESGAACTIKDHAGLVECARIWQSHKGQKDAGAKARAYVEASSGATQKILFSLKQELVP